MPRTCKELIKDYCANCTFAGIHFIADDSKHWIERWFWIAMVVLSWYGSALLIIAAWDAFINNPISFGVETTYTQWDTEMPAVAICEFANDNKVYEVADTIWPPDHLLDLEDALKEIAYYRGISYSLVQVCFKSKNPDPLCPVSNYSFYASLVRSGCSRIIRNCSYNDKPFDCCEYFQPIDTDMGACFMMNSIQTKTPKLLRMVNNLQHKRSEIKFQVYVQSTIYTIGQDEVPSITTLQSSSLKIKLGHSYRRQITVTNIVNDPLIVQTPIEKRACRFHDEVEEYSLYPLYSYSACTTLCRKRAQLDLCKCNDHFMLGTAEHERCNISGMACLHLHTSHLTILKPRWAQRPGITCDCFPSCNETEIAVIKDSVKSTKATKKKADVELSLAYLPTQRFRRNVVRSRLDLVVSVGGTTGLFVGASILSFVELIFYFTVRFVSNVIWMKKKKLDANERTTDEIENAGAQEKYDGTKNVRDALRDNGKIRESVLINDRFFNKYNKKPLDRKHMYHLKVYKKNNT